MAFTDEQRRRMEENRARAQARLREKRMAQSPAGSAVDEGRGAIGGGAGVAATTTAEAVARDTRGGIDPPPPPPTGAAQDRNNAGDTTVKNNSSNKNTQLVDGPGPDGELEPEPEPEPAEPGRPEARKASARSSTRTGGGGRGGAAAAAAAAINGSSMSESRNSGTGGGTDAAADVAKAVCEGCAGAEDDARVDKELLEGFGVTVCRTCKLKIADYQCVTKKEAKETYLLPEGTIAVLKFVERDNPRHSSWTKMKLYLRRDVAGYSYKRWGSKDGLAAEKHRRDSLKYDRTLARTQGMFKRSRSETEDDGAGGFV